MHHSQEHYEDLGISLSPAEIREFAAMDESLRHQWDRTSPSTRGLSPAEDEVLAAALRQAGLDFRPPAL